MHKLDELLAHSGVKGMKWGVRHDQPASGTTKPKERGKVAKHLDSLSRERQWHKTLKEVDKMSTKDINTVTKRIAMENSLKRLSKTKMATKKDKQDYLRRHEMSDQELARKISRLQAKDSLHKTVKEASKEQRELGLKVAQVGGSLGVKYAINRKITPKDVYETVKKPKESAAQAKKDAAKLALEKAKKIKVKS